MFSKNIMNKTQNDIGFIPSIMNHRTKIAVLSFETVLVFSNKLLEIVKEYTVEKIFKCQRTFGRFVDNDSSYKNLLS